MKALILLGAGASVEAGLPTANELTTRLIDSLGSEGSDGAYRKIATTVAQALKKRPEDDLGSLNCEELFRALNQLEERRETPLSRFVDSWSTAVPEMVERFRQAFPDYSADAAQSEAFRQTHLRLRQRLVNLLWIEETRSDRAAYLHPLVRAAFNFGIPIVSLNYDNTIELASRSLEIPFDYGISRWNFEHKVEFEKGALRLLKLHGSLNWLRRTQTGFRKDGVFNWRTTSRYSLLREMWKSVYVAPELLFGVANKPRPHGPWFDLHHAFQAALLEADQLVVVGFSFGDWHVTEYIDEWLCRDRARKMIVLDPGLDFDGEWYRDRLPFINGNGVGVIEVGRGQIELIRKPASAGIPSIVDRWSQKALVSTSR